MIVKKITVGFVVQKFDTKTKKFVSQEFVAGDEVTFEDEHWEILDDNEIEEYLPFEMVQPE
jgi:hypothetical protein